MRERWCGLTTWTVPAVVLRVIDGDTVHLQLDLGWHTYRTENCRVAGINAPELNTREGQAARTFAAVLLNIGDPVTFESHSLDKYGRPLGAISYGKDGLDFATQMLSAGHAVPYQP